MMYIASTAEEISIHALRVEGDPWAKIRHTHKITISIHALRVEGDVPFGANSYLFILFLSTPSGWRATSAQCAARLLRTISIHALRVEGDHLFSDCPLLIRISIHALRVEGDAPFGNILAAARDFYPRPPGGGRLFIRIDAGIISRFLSTPSGWRATSTKSPQQRRRRFLSTPSGWRATVAAKSIMSFVPISIHALRVEGDLIVTCLTPRGLYFYPRPPGGGRLS